jgi:ArsR family transcriptional regulator
LTKQERARSETRARILKALGHPSRLFVVEKLAEKPYCVCELTEMIGADTSTVSKHLSILRSAGIVSTRKEGTTVYYSLEAPCILRLIQCVETVARHTLEGQLADLESVPAR